MSVAHDLDPYPPGPVTTQAAEGMRRRRFTVAEIDAFVAAGVMDPKERTELIGGELVPMAAKGIRHERLKTWINAQLARQLSGDLLFTPETTFRLSLDTFLEPDFVVYRKTDDLTNLTGETCLLAIEVADTSLSYDRGRKAEIFARFGVRELWVIDAAELATRVFREPGPMGYRRVVDRARRDALMASAVPDLRLCLADFG